MIANAYRLVNESLNKEEFKQKYGEKSFGYKSQNNGVYQIVAISDFEPQYLKSFLLIDHIDFLGTDTTINIQHYAEVL